MGREVSIRDMRFALTVTILSLAALIVLGDMLRALVCIVSALVAFYVIARGGGFD